MYYFNPFAGTSAAAPHAAAVAALMLQQTPGITVSGASTGGQVVWSLDKLNTTKLHAALRNCLVFACSRCFMACLLLSAAVLSVQPDEVYDKMRNTAEDMYNPEKREDSHSNSQDPALPKHAPLRAPDLSIAADRKNTIIEQTRPPPQPTVGVDRYSGWGFIRGDRLVDPVSVGYLGGWLNMCWLFP